jgi:hypothetical protein
MKTINDGVVFNPFFVLLNPYVNAESFEIETSLFKLIIFLNKEGHCWQH